MSAKTAWTQPKLIRINPFGGSFVNPYEYNGSSVVFTGGRGDATVVGGGPLGNITDYDGNPGTGNSSFLGPYYLSTVAPYS